VTLRSLAFGVIAALALQGGASAQTYPDHPVRVIVPIGPGGACDQIGHLLANKLSEQFNQGDPRYRHQAGLALAHDPEAADFSDKIVRQNQLEFDY
jgi:hypothetical protein